MGIENITPEQRALIDIQLKKIADINCQIGIETTASEKAEYRKLINECLKEIKLIDVEFWEQICPDKKDKI